MKQDGAQAANSNKETKPSAAAPTPSQNTNAPLADAATTALDEAKKEAEQIIANAKNEAENLIADAEKEISAKWNEAMSEIENIRKEAQIVLDKLKAEPTAPKTSAINFAEGNTVTNNPTFIEREIDGVPRKWKIRGKHFSIAGNDYSDADLAREENKAIIDEWIATSSGPLEEVFEDVEEPAAPTE